MQDIIDYIHIKNIRASLITNGSLLTEEFIMNNKGKLEQIGLSIDSIKESTNLMLGRCQNNKTFNYQKLVSICKAIKLSGIKLKINTVVSKLNINEDITKLLDEVEPDRIKILQMKPTTEVAKKYEVSESEFENYTKKYSGYKTVIENGNITELSTAYPSYILTVDKDGNFVEKSNDIKEQIRKNFSETTKAREEAKAYNDAQGEKLKEIFNDLKEEIKKIFPSSI